MFSTINLILGNLSTSIFIYFFKSLIYVLILKRFPFHLNSKSSSVTHRKELQNLRNNIPNLPYE